MPTGLRQRHADRREILALPERRLAVARIEGVERKIAGAPALAQDERRPQRDQPGHGVADRRAIGDVAANGAGVADLHRADAADQLAEIRVVAGQCLGRVRIGGRRADLEMSVRLADEIHLPDAANMDDGIEVLVMLGNPEADVGAAGKDRRVRMGLYQIGERILGHRREVAAARALQGQRVRARNGLELLRRLPFPPGEPVGAAAAKGRHCRVDDRPVAGAAAEVSCDHVVDPGAIRPRLAAVHREQRHDESRGAEPALRAVMVDHRLLHRMQRAVRLAEILDRNELFSVQRRDEQDAGVDRTVAQPVPVQLAQHDRARAAIAFRATLLGAGLAGLRAQPVEDGHVGIDAIERHDFIAVEEAHGHGQLPL